MLFLCPLEVTMVQDGHLVECLVLEEGVERALPLLIIQGLEKLLNGGGYLGLGGGGCAGGGDGAEEAGPGAAAGAAHAVAEVLQPDEHIV